MECREYEGGWEKRLAIPKKGYCQLYEGSLEILEDRHDPASPGSVLASQLLHKMMVRLVSEASYNSMERYLRTAHRS